MFRGRENATIDAKGRLKIPSVYLPEMRRESEDIYVTSKTGTYAMIYPMKVWEGIEEKLKTLPTQNPTRRKFQAITSYYGATVKPDAQGRILLPAELREKASLTGQVIVLGGQDYLQVWNRTRFVEQEVEANPWTTVDDETLGI